jgi:putative transposase
VEELLMPSTHISLYYHFIFSTKERRRWIAELWEKRLHAYLGGIVRKLGGVPLITGGDLDHVHILASLKATHCVAEFIRDLKSNSSGWIHSEIGLGLFGWQDGYGAYTVGRGELGSVRGYIEQQKEHHRRKTFMEEYVEILREYGIDFDVRYLWQTRILSPLQGSSLCS